MKGKEKTMTEIRSIIQRLRLHQSYRCIHRELKVHRSIIRNLYKLAMAHQWLDPSLPMPSDEEIAQAQKHPAKDPAHFLDPYYEQLKQWNKEGLSSVVIQRLLRDKNCTCSDQVIRRYRRKHFPKLTEPVMVRPTVPGRDLELDFGELGRFLNDDGEVKKVWLFSLRLRHSRLAYREIVLNQKLPTFLMGHVHAFEYFNGVPAKCIPDNLKAAVILSSIDNDGINHAYQELAEYYGFIIDPCLPRTPEHKGGVEGDVKYFKRDFLSYFLAKQRDMGISIPMIRDLLEAKQQWEQETAHVHLIQGIGRSPLELFASEEKQALRPLPQHRFEIAVWRRCAVRRDWRIMLESSYYSVPYHLIDETVDVRMTNSLIRIFHNHQEVALHERATKKWEYKRKTEHAPPYEEAVLQSSRDGLLALSQEVGPFTHQFVQSLLSHPSIDKLKPIRHLLGLSKKYSRERLEKACERACICQLLSYKSVKSILETGLDSQGIEVANTGKIIPLPRYRFARDPADYKSASNDRSETLEEKLEKRHPVSKHGNAMAGVFNGLIADQVAEESKQGWQ